MSEPTEVVVEGLRHLVEEFESDLDRRPTSRELLSLLGHGLRTLGVRLADVDMAQLASSKATYRDGARPSDVDETAELNDASWEEAGSLAHRIVDAFVAPPLLDDLLAALVAGVHGCDDGLLHDIATTDITGLEVDLDPPPKGRRPKDGDIVAIAGTEYRAVVISAKNRAGTAYGILGTDGQPALRHPVLSDDEQVRLGKWPIVGHDEGLIEAFAEPERFHRPPPVLDEDLGEHGVAESLDATRSRFLSAQEAHEAGLDRDDFRQSLMSEALATWLAARLS